VANAMRVARADAIQANGDGRARVRLQAPFHLHRHSGFAVQPGSRLLGALSPPFPETGNLQNSLSGARSATIIFFRVTRVTPPEAE